jgi:hypothetical protein
MNLNRTTLETVSRLDDPLGVLSVYVDLSPETRSQHTGSLAVPVRNRLEELETALRNDSDPERLRAFRARREELAGTLARLGDLTQSGRGRALFVPLGVGDPVEVESQVPFPTTVELEETAFIRPLVEAYSADPPAGLAVLAKGGIRVFDHRAGETVEVMEDEFRTDVDDVGSTKGGGFASRTTGAGSSGTGVMVPDKDEFARFEDDEIARLLRRAAEQVAVLTDRHAWEWLVVAGDERLRDTFLGSLGARKAPEVVRVDRHLTWQAPDELWQLVQPELVGARDARLEALVQRARDGAFTPGGHGAVGLAPVLEALNEARVANLLFDRGRDLVGAVAPDGRLAVPGSPPLGVEASALLDEPRLVERMIDQALATSAEVTPLSGPAAEALAEHGGVAAVLRW